MLRIRHKKTLSLCLLALFVGLNNYVIGAEEGLGEDVASRQGLAEIIASGHRAGYNVRRDSARNPLETLMFFELRPGMHVAEIWPGGGAYYAEIIAPFVAAKGRYYAVVPTLSGSSRANQILFERFEARPDLYGTPMRADMSGRDLTLYVDDSLDLVVSFRNIHNWVDGGYERHFFAGIYRALKPGGRFGLTEHRLDGSPHEEKGVYGGYVTEDYAIDVAASVGFTLVARSEINANPKDTKDYPQGVWTLPPTLALGQQDRDRYIRIGESDRMTLLFEKPGS